MSILLLVLACLPGCRPSEPAPPVGDGSTASPASRSTAGRPRIVVLGDSLTAGLGLPLNEAYPSLLQQRIDHAGLPFDVVNAGVSGDTTAGGLRRLDWVLNGDVRVLIVALGANDGMRGLPVAETKRNLATIVATARNRGVAVLLTGMEAPPNFGDEYTGAFRATFRDVARQQGVPFVPFLLQGVAGQADLNQADGIHPNPEGARRVAELVWRALEPMLSPT